MRSRSLHIHACLTRPDTDSIASHPVDARFFPLLRTDSLHRL